MQQTDRQKAAERANGRLEESRRGRPRKPDSEALQYVVTARLTVSEYKSLKRLCYTMRRGDSLSDCIRRLVRCATHLDEYTGEGDQLDIPVF